MITTGTDVNHTFAVDVFARKNNLVISDMELAKEMAALLIRGKTIAWGAGEGFVFPKEQTIPEQLRFQKMESPDGKQGTLWFAIPQSDREQEEALGTEQTRMLHLYPKNVYLGLQEKHTGRKDRNTDSEVSVRTWNSYRTDYPGSQHRSEKRRAGTAGVL